MGYKTKIVERMRSALAEKHPGVDFWIRGDDKTVILEKVVVPQKERGGGKGSAFMDDLTKMASDSGVTVALTPSADFGGNKKRLEGFYKSFGFKPNSGKNKDYGISEAMYRLPSVGVAAGAAGMAGGYSSKSSADIVNDITGADWAAALKAAKNGDTIEAPSRDWAAALAEYARRYNKAIEDRPLLGMVAPEAPDKLLNKLAYNDNRTHADYLMATLGVM